MRGFVAGHRLAGRAVADVAGAVADRKVCSISVEPMPSSTSTPATVAPALADMRRQRLAGRHAEPQAVGAGAACRCPCARAARYRATARRRRCRPVPAHDLEHAVGRRPMRPQHGGGADRHRERHGVAEPVGEEQLGRRVHHVVLADAEDALAEQLARSPSGWSGRA